MPQSRADAPGGAHFLSQTSSSICMCRAPHGAKGLLSKGKAHTDAIRDALSALNVLLAAVRHKREAA